MNEFFRKFANKTSAAVGSSWAFIAAVAIIVVWAVTGPMFHYSDTWQLVINTGTTIITFLMVFLIQNTQNRDAKAIHLKLDELIKATTGAHNSMIDLDKLSDEQLKELEEEYKRICETEVDTDESGDAAALKEVKQELAERES
ncbi:MAG TPA: low affinity iron permease family protein [Pyrinomonadaceae bacterium]